MQTTWHHARATSGEALLEVCRVDLEGAAAAETFERLVQEVRWNRFVAPELKPRERIMPKAASSFVQAGRTSKRREIDVRDILRFEGYLDDDNNDVGERASTLRRAG